MPKLRPKVFCEICGLKKKSILHRHHIIPRCDPRSTDSDSNLAVLCPNCHSRVHTGEFTIIGVYQTSDGRLPVWFKKGEDPPFAENLWIVKDNPMIVTLSGDEDDLPDEGDNDERNKTK